MKITKKELDKKYRNNYSFEIHYFRYLATTWIKLSICVNLLFLFDHPFSLSSFLFGSNIYPYPYCDFWSYPTNMKIYPTINIYDPLIFLVYVICFITSICEHILKIYGDLGSQSAT